MGFLTHWCPKLSRRVARLCAACEHYKPEPGHKKVPM